MTTILYDAFKDAYVKSDAFRCPKSPPGVEA
ncbi:hypothetical protein DSM25559_1148 [Agrobacterium rosae]|uniref:Uncharacterized protein n=1 Tax=Agrobacterium rosae TaxID=1972867 RepID=A0A1R3TEW0_9HYPH|nr:hypothetical protein DSM25559_1148 [Agrobacterium rosae]